jgi:23S rRNA (adenine2503-C2)-methyltransferase
MNQNSESKENLIGKSLSEMGRLPLLEPLPAFRRKQLFSWIYAKGAADFSAMSSLSQDLRKQLSDVYSISQLPVIARNCSGDGATVKFLFNLADDLEVEAVMMRTERRDTICISTQVGCAYGCEFCATGRMGIKRNLTVYEMISQVMVIQAELRRSGSEGHFNLVFMGMGEPLANYDALVQTIALLNDEDGLAVGRRRMTVSTVGLLPEIKRLAEEAVSVRLAFSLNATTNPVRDKLMPINRTYPFRQVLPALAAYAERSSNRVTLEYVLIGGLNDSAADAKRLAEYGRKYKCKIHLIVLNPNEGMGYYPPSADEVKWFYETLLPMAPTVSIRYSKGGDIAAGCGQLATGSRGGRRPGRSTQ